MAPQSLTPLHTVKSNNDEERRLRVQRTLQRLVKATAELEELQRPKGSVERLSIAPGDPSPPSRK
jgi:hypothetical protein